MADDESTNPTPEVEAPDTDDFDDLFEADETTETEESTTDEAATESEVETEETSEQSDEAEPEESQEESEEAPSDEDQGEQTAPKEPQTDEERKQYNQLMYERRQAEKALREERRARQEETIDRYLQEAENDEMEYNKRLLEVEAYNLQQERINVNIDALSAQAEKAVATIDLFQTNDPVIKQELEEAIDEFEKSNVEYDRFGNPTKVKGSLYEHLQKKADSIRRIQGVGERQATKDKSETKARTVKPPSKTPKQPKSDDALAGFDEEADRW